MERVTPLSGSVTGGARGAVEDIAHAAHRTTDKIVDETTARVDRLGGAAHRAVDRTAGVASSAAEWTSTISERAGQVKTQVTEAASASIRERPIATVVGALVVGYLLGRLARP